MKQTYRWLLWLCAGAALPMLGCAKGPAFAEVQGSVKLRGKPLSNVRVEFLPDPVAGTKGPSSSGITDKNGRYTLKADKGSTGAVVGNHRVLIHDLIQYEGLPPDRTPDDAKLKPPRVHGSYMDANAIPLKKEVKTGANIIDLDVSPP